MTGFKSKHLLVKLLQTLKPGAPFKLLYITPSLLHHFFFGQQSQISQKCFADGHYKRGLTLIDQAAAELHLQALYPHPQNPLVCLSSSLQDIKFSSYAQEHDTFSPTNQTIEENWPVLTTRCPEGNPGSWPPSLWSSSYSPYRRALSPDEAAWRREGADKNVGFS